MGGGEGSSAASAIWSNRTSPECWTTRTPTRSDASVKLRRCALMKVITSSSSAASCAVYSAGSSFCMDVVAITLKVLVAPSCLYAPESVRA